MKAFVVLAASSLVVLGILPAAAAAQRVHEIRVEGNAEKDVHRFQPDRINAKPGDILLFRAVSGTPHSVVFEGGKLSPRSREALNGALTRRAADLSSPLLTPDGTEYRMVVPPLPPGTYEFFCLPHRAYDERGALEITR